MGASIFGLKKNCLFIFLELLGKNCEEPEVRTQKCLLKLKTKGKGRHTEKKPRNRITPGTF